MNRLKIFLYRLYRKFVPDENLYLFLDIDGVLNSVPEEDDANKHAMWFTSDHKHDSGNDYVTEDRLELLLDFCRKHNVKVIGISSWFTAAPNCFYPKGVPNMNGKTVTTKYDKAVALLWDFFWQYLIPMHGVIEYTGGGKARAQQIRNYVDKFCIRKFIVLDDSISIYERYTKMWVYHCVFPDARKGLTHFDIQRLESKVVSLEFYEHQNLLDQLCHPNRYPYRKR